MHDGILHVGWDNVSVRGFPPTGYFSPAIALSGTLSAPSSPNRLQRLGLWKWWLEQLLLHNRSEAAIHVSALSTLSALSALSAII